jgi:hypothetical protein
MLNSTGTQTFYCIILAITPVNLCSPIKFHGGVLPGICSHLIKNQISDINKYVCVCVLRNITLNLAIIEILFSERVKMIKMRVFVKLDHYYAVFLYMYWICAHITPKNTFLFLN